MTFPFQNPLAELRVFQAAQLTVHDVDADSAIWTRSSIITDDRSSCKFSDDEEVSECVYHNATIVGEKSMQLCKCRCLCSEVFKRFFRDACCTYAQV